MEQGKSKHIHEWVENDNYLVCPICNKKKLKIVEANNNINTGIKANGEKYSIRQDRSRIFYPEEWKKFYDALKKQQKFTFDILMLTGARIMEVQHIKVEDIDFSNQRLVLRVTKHSGKANKSTTRTIRVSSYLIKQIKNRIKELNLQKTDTLKILSTSSANKAMKKALIKSQIKDPELFSIHNIRKTAENWCLSLGVDSLKLSKRFGHNLVTMYMHYTQSDAFSYKEKDFIKAYFGDTFIE